MMSKGVFDIAVSKTPFDTLADGLRFDILKHKLLYATKKAQKFVD